MTGTTNAQPESANSINGVYIVDANCKLYNYDDTTVSNAVGVAIISDNCCFMMGLTKIANIPWASSSLSSYDSNIPNVPSDDEVVIENYYDGATYTNEIISYFGTSANSTNCAAYYAKNNFSKIFGILSYLGSYAEWKLVENNYIKVRDALLNARGFNLDDLEYGSTYWSSSESQYADRALGMYFDLNSNYTGRSMISKDLSDSETFVVPFYRIERPYLSIA